MSARRHRLTRALATQLTRRGLWTYLPRPVSDAPDGPPTLALSFDLDYQADTDALVPLLELMASVRGRVRSTLFCIGKLVEQSPNAYREATRAGHEIANHTWSHPNNPVLNPNREFWHLSVEQMAEEIARCQDAIAHHTGIRPIGFRTPHFKDAYRMMEAIARDGELTYLSTALASKGPVPTPYLPGADPWLGDLSLHYPVATPSTNRARGPAPARVASSEGATHARGGLERARAEHAGGVEASPAREMRRWPQLMIPLTACPGMRWSPFCTYSSIRRPSDPARGAGLLSIERWERLWRRMLVRARPRRFASVYFDPSDLMRDEDTRRTFARMLEHATNEGWNVSSLAEVERLWRPQVNV